MKTLIALSTALLLSFTVPAYAGSNPEPVKKHQRHDMMTKKKKHKKHNKKKKSMNRGRKGKGCNMVE